MKHINTSIQRRIFLQWISSGILLAGVKPIAAFSENCDGSFLEKSDTDSHWIEQEKHVKNGEVIIKDPSKCFIEMQAKLHSGMPTNVGAYGVYNNNEILRNVKLSTTVTFSRPNYSILSLRSNAQEQSCYALLIHPNGSAAIVKVNGNSYCFLKRKNIHHSIQQAQIGFYVMNNHIQADIFYNQSETVHLAVTDSGIKDGYVGLGVGNPLSIFSSQQIDAAFDFIRIEKI